MKRYRNWKRGGMHSESPESFSGAFLPSWDLLAVKVC